MRIGPYETSDWPEMWRILEPVFRSGETYAVRTDIGADDAQRFWTAEPKSVFVAIDDAARAVVGTYFLRPNHDGPGAHVCNCGYVVSETARGQGVASRLCEHSQAEAIALGYRAMQFNLVAATNAGAVRLWKKLGFEIVGTLPGAFRHPRAGWVDAYVMFKRLDDGR